MNTRNAGLALLALVLLAGCAWDLPPVERGDGAAADTLETSVSQDGGTSEDAGSPEDGGMLDGGTDVIEDVSSDTASADIPTAPPPRSLIYRSKDRGDFWFCGQNGDYDPHQFGYRGCCTNGRWLMATDNGRAPGVYPGTYVRTPTSEVVNYIMTRRDGSLARVVFPTTFVLISWWSGSPWEKLPTQNPRGCSTLELVSDAELNALPQVTALFRAGTVFTATRNDARRFVAGARRTLYPIRFSGGAAGLDIWTSRYNYPLPESVFRDYTIGEPIDVSGSDSQLEVLRRYTSDKRFVDIF